MSDKDSINITKKAIILIIYIFKQRILYTREKTLDSLRLAYNSNLVGNLARFTELNTLIANKTNINIKYSIDYNKDNKDL